MIATKNSSSARTWQPKETVLSVTVQSVAGRQGEYLAYFRSELLDATFSVYFRDNLAGALALHSFALCNPTGACRIPT